MLSFLMLGAKCRYCRKPISWRYPGVELLTGSLFAVVAWYDFQAGGHWYDAVFYCLFAAILLCVFFIDLEHFVIPTASVFWRFCWASRTGWRTALFGTLWQACSAMPPLSI